MIKQFIVDAFESGPFTGNPAAVCPLEGWLEDSTLQAIAAQNNLSETAFIVKEGGDYRLRWFTPTTEIQLCGHATLASAHVLLEELDVGHGAIEFETLSGRLTVTRRERELILELPATAPANQPEPAPVLAATRLQGRVTRDQAFILVAVDGEEAVREYEPDLAGIAGLDAVGVIVTAPGEQDDFVYRMFAPRVGIDEDPATGSAQCALAPYWGEILDRTLLSSKQLSPRTGTFTTRWLRSAQRVEIAGGCRTFSRGELYL